MTFYDKLFIYLNKRSIRGKDRLYSLFQKIGFKKLLLVDCSFGIKMYLNPYEYIDSITIKQGFYESEVTEAILSVLGGNDTFWDIGANIGLQSIAVKKNRPNAKVISFEPNPEVSGLLCANINLNQLDVETFGFALFDTLGITTLYIANGNSGMTTLAPWSEHQYKATAKCQTLTGNYLVENGFTIPAVLKIDTEGSELEVIKGCSAFLSNPIVKAVIIESSAGLTIDDEENDFIATLLDHGFNKLTELNRKEATHHNLSNYIISKSL